MLLCLKIRDHTSLLMQNLIRHVQYRHLPTESYHSDSCYLFVQLASLGAIMQRTNQHKLTPFFQMCSVMLFLFSKYNILWQWLLQVLYPWHKVPLVGSEPFPCLLTSNSLSFDRTPWSFGNLFCKLRSLSLICQFFQKTLHSCFISLKLFQFH